MRLILPSHLGVGHNACEKIKIIGMERHVFINTGDVRILGGIVFSQFILTCIFTGGPVTWTRDSTIVTEGNRTVLNDPLTAQYTHTLTMTLRGLYTCTVANNKPSRDSASKRVSYFQLWLKGVFLCTELTVSVVVKLQAQ